MDTTRMGYNGMNGKRISGVHFPFNPLNVVDVDGCEILHQLVTSGNYETL